MQSLIDELKFEIFKLTRTPISLVLTDRNWYAISQDPNIRAEWLIYKYGKAHALFHSVRLGKKFISVEVVQALLVRNALISRYFVQRLVMHFGAYDELLIDLKIEHNVNSIDSNRIHAFRKKLHSPWASDLPLTIFTKLITEGYNIDINLAIKGNDMELFHFLSAGPLSINFAYQKLLQNLGEIKDLILNKKFVPFPPRPKPIYEDTIEYNQLMQAKAHEEYPPKDGYENSRQLNVVARAILIYPNLVKLWKEIGYYEICSDVNELVMQGALLTLFPPTPPANWACPSVDDIVNRLMTLINLGFRLTDAVMEEAFHLFEHRLNEIGNLLLNSFQVIRKESKSTIASFCLIQAIKPERNHKKIDLLELLNENIDEPEKALDNALEHHDVGFKFDVNSIKSTRIRSLSVHSNFYYWVLKRYGTNSEIAQKCFDDILESRIWIDLKLQENPERSVPENLTTCAFNAICSIYLEFCKERIPFKANHLPYLKLANNEEIIKPFFEINLSVVFGLQLMHIEINYDYNRPEVNNKIQEKFNETNDQLDNNEIEEKWFKLLEKNFDQILTNNSSDITENFKNNFKEFWKKIIDRLRLNKQSIEFCG